MKRDWIAYDGSDMVLGSARELARRLRASGEFEVVRVDRKRPGLNGAGEWQQFGRVFVARREVER